MELKELENNLTTEVVNAIHEVGGNSAFKVVKDVVKYNDLSAEQLVFLGQYCQKISHLKRKEKAKSEGKVLTKRLDSEMIVAGLIHILTHRTTPDETMEFIRQQYNQPEDWVGKVKNRPIPKQERSKAVKQLKEKDIELLTYMVADKRTTYKEISEPETWNKQLGELRRTITLSDRVDALERENKELLAFRDQQLKLNEEQARFNLAVIQEFDTQKKLILSTLNLKAEHLGVSEEEVLFLSDSLAGISSEKDRWQYLLDKGYTKAFISKLTDIPYATLKRKMKKLGVS